jgi:chemotaxis protein CheC
MAIDNFSDITEGQFDALREIGNIGLGNATTALSDILDCKIDMKQPEVKLVDINKIPDMIGGAENLIVGIMLTLSGDINGMMMFAIGQKSARQLANRLLGKSGDETQFDYMDFSVLKEVGHIIAGAYLTAISTLTGMTTNSSVPQATFDMAGAILSVPAIAFGRMGDKAIMIDAAFDGGENEMEGYFIMIPDLESYNKIMEKFGL